jgi:hypothetical protein
MSRRIASGKSQEVPGGKVSGKSQEVPGGKVVIEDCGGTTCLIESPICIKIMHMMMT